MKDAPLSDLSRQASIDTENQLMAFYDSSWKYCPDTGIITVVYTIFYQVGPIDHGTHIPGPVAQSSVEIQYNAACISGMYLAHFRMLINELFNKDTDIVPKGGPLIILDNKSVVCMANTGKYKKYTSHIDIRVHLVRNGGN